MPNQPPSHLDSSSLSRTEHPCAIYIQVSHAQPCLCHPVSFEANLANLSARRLQLTMIP